jgi:hypothetical protein
MAGRDHKAKMQTSANCLGAFMSLFLDGMVSRSSGLCRPPQVRDERIDRAVMMSLAVQQADSEGILPAKHYDRCRAKSQGKHLDARVETAHRAGEVAAPFHVCGLC